MSEFHLDAMLKMNEIELELFSDIDMHLFIGKGMTGGIFTLLRENSKSNNKYMQPYDVYEPSKLKFLFIKLN